METENIRLSAQRTVQVATRNTRL